VPFRPEVRARLRGAGEAVEDHGRGIGVGGGGGLVGGETGVLLCCVEDVGVLGSWAGPPGVESGVGGVGVVVAVDFWVVALVVV
jgi:hypothetical protein